MESLTQERKIKILRITKKNSDDEQGGKKRKKGKKKVINIQRKKQTMKEKDWQPCLKVSV